MSRFPSYPIDADLILRELKSFRRELLNREDFIEKRIALLSGSTISAIKNVIELFLLRDGIQPIFHESEYNRYYEDLMFPNPELERFSPDLIYIFTSNVNILRYPGIHDSAEDVDALLASETGRYQAMWDRISSQYHCPVIQNNFEMPHYRLLGNLDAYELHGRCRYVAELNRFFAEQARVRQNLFLVDLHYLSSWFGLERWYDKTYWYMYKYAMSYEAIPHLANSVASVIKAIYGKSKKCLVLDLDNTLWGGVIGDDGLSGIQIGKETPEAEAYTEFQTYVRSLKDIGVLLAVCSKNETANAKEGFAHPDSILKLGDFASFKANWEPKSENIKRIAEDLSIGRDSLVFADDNPAERDIVRAQTPDVAVPEIGQNVTDYIHILDQTGYFESVSLSAEDVQRSAFYAGNALRKEVEGAFTNYEEFLASLQMRAEIRSFAPIYHDRITQLINKSNQFNVTTRRYTEAEVSSLAADPSVITLYGRLVDKFGDNGLVSIMIAKVQDGDLHLDLWLMSCRVLKRGMELAMFDALVGEASKRGIHTIVGYYYPTAKNAMVKGLFARVGFEKTSEDDKGNTTWRYCLSDSYTAQNLHIEVAHER
jgi:FkbH-like protein